MNISLAFTRLFFTLISVFIITTYMVSSPHGSLVTNTFTGIVCGLIFSLFLFGVDTLFRRYNLRSFNIAIIGIFIGYLMGQALVLVFDAILKISTIAFILSPTAIELIEIALFLFGTYIGTIMILRSSDELYVSIPFVKFSATAQKKRDILLDQSVLSDARIIDLCSTGLLDHHLVIPRFVIKDLYATVEGGDATSKAKSKRCLESIKKLEGVTNLEIRYHDTDFPEVKDQTSKLIRLARLIDANLLTADISRVQMASIEGVKIINMHSLSNALKPLMEAGEFIKIKVQRQGKEPNQGVGYLEDGTMVVINGGGDFIGDTIEVQVLSVKHTSSGRMIFCNTFEEEEAQAGRDQSHDD